MGSSFIRILTLGTLSQYRVSSIVFSPKKSENFNTASMTGQPPFDLESFQSLLSDAYAAPESGASASSLTAAVELQRKIAIGELDADCAMDLVAVRAREVARATGIVVGLLKGGQLVYRAGSGSGVAYVGKQMMGTFSVSRKRSCKERNTSGRGCPH